MKEIITKAVPKKEKPFTINTGYGMFPAMSAN